MAESLHEMAKRMCKGRVCGECPLRLRAQPCLKTILEGRSGFDGAVDALRAWAAANPVKTYKDDFFEKLSGAGKQPDGYPLLHVISLYEIAESRRDEYRKAKHHDEWDKPIGYWNAPLGTWGEKEKNDA